MDSVSLGMDIEKHLTELKAEVNVLQQKLSALSELIAKGFEFEEKFKQISNHQSAF
jgi:hypothetical protein